MLSITTQTLSIIYDDDISLKNNCNMAPRKNMDTTIPQQMYGRSGKLTPGINSSKVGYMFYNTTKYFQKLLLYYLLSNASFRTHTRTHKH